MAEKIMSEAAGQVLAGEIKDVKSGFSSGWKIAKVGKVRLNQDVTTGNYIQLFIDISDLNVSDPAECIVSVMPFIDAANTNWGSVGPLTYNTGLSDRNRIGLQANFTSQRVGAGYGFHYIILLPM